MGACCDPNRGDKKESDEIEMGKPFPLKSLKKGTAQQTMNLRSVKINTEDSLASIKAEPSPLVFHPLYLVRELQEKLIESIYEIIDVIGKGTYGSVHLVKNKMTEKLCVLKMLKKLPEIDPNTINLEAQILKKLVLPF